MDKYADRYVAGFSPLDAKPSIYFDVTYTNPDGEVFKATVVVDRYRSGNVKRVRCLLVGNTPMAAWLCYNVKWAWDRNPSLATWASWSGAIAPDTSYIYTPLYGKG